MISWSSPCMSCWAISSSVCSTCSPAHSRRVRDQVSWRRLCETFSQVSHSSQSSARPVASASRRMAKGARLPSRPSFVDGDVISLVIFAR
jgi:hypothetical protein